MFFSRNALFFVLVCKHKDVRCNHATYKESSLYLCGTIAIHIQ